MASFSIIDLTKQTYQLILKDKIILLPYIIFLLIVAFFDTTVLSFRIDNTENVSFIKYLGHVLQWVVELGFKSLIILMSYSLYKNQSIDINYVMQQLKKRFIHLFIASGIIYFPLFVATLSISKHVNAQGSPVERMFLFGFGIILLFVLLLLIFIPILVLTEDKSGFSSIADSFKFIVKNIWDVTVFLGMLLTVIFVFIMFNQPFMLLPVIGSTIVPAFFLGISTSIALTLTLTFYYGLKEGSMKRNCTMVDKSNKPPDEM